MGDLPDALKPLVHRAQECIRQQITLKTAWSPMKSSNLPVSLDLTIIAIQEAYDTKDTRGNRSPAIEAGCHLLLDNNNPQAQILRTKAQSLVGDLS